MRNNFTVQHAPVGKPTMSQRDRWKERDAVVRYRSFCDAVREACTGKRDQKIDGMLYMAMIAFAHRRIPKSYSDTRRQALEGQICDEKPDTDNITKSVGDALFGEDKWLGGTQCWKFWAYDDEEERVDVFLIPIPLKRIEQINKIR